MTTINIETNVAWIGSMSHRLTIPFRWEIRNMHIGVWHCQYSPGRSMSFWVENPQLKNGFTEQTEELVVVVPGRYIDTNENEPYGYHDGFFGLCRQPLGNPSEINSLLLNINNPRFYLYHDAPIDDMFTPTGHIRRIRPDAPKKLVNQNQFYHLLPEIANNAFSSVPVTRTSHGNATIRLTIDINKITKNPKTLKEITNPQLFPGRYKRTQLITETREVTTWVN